VTAAEVQHNGIARLDHPLPRLMVRVGSIGTGSDDGEVDLFMSELSQQIGKIGSNVGLSPTSKTPLHDLAVGGVCRRPCGCQSHPKQMHGPGRVGDVGQYPSSQIKSGLGVTMTPASPSSTAEFATRLIRSAKSSLVNGAGAEGLVVVIAASFRF